MISREKWSHYRPLLCGRITSRGTIPGTQLSGADGLAALWTHLPEMFEPSSWSHPHSSVVRWDGQWGLLHTDKAIVVSPISFENGTTIEIVSSKPQWSLVPAAWMVTSTDQKSP